MSAWERREPLVAAAGDVGGDQQISDAYNAKWVRRLDESHWSVVTRIYYVADTDDGRAILEKTEYVVCTDPGDPGSTEVASSGADATVAYDEPMNDRAVQDAAREAWAPTNAEWNNQMHDWRVPW